MASATQPPRVFYGWWVVTSLATVIFLGTGLGFYSLGVFVTPLEEEFGWSRGELSVGIALGSIVSGLLGPFVGQAVERVGARRVLAVGAVGMGVCFALLGLTWSLAYLYVMFMSMAAWRSGIMLIPVSRVVGNWFERRRGLAMGVTTTGIGFGGLVMAPLSKVLISSVGWRSAFFILGALVIAVALPLILLVVRQHPADRGLQPDGTRPMDPPPELPAGSRLRAVPAPAAWSALDAIRTRAFVLSTIAISLGFASLGAVLLHTSPFFEDRGVAPEVAGLILGLVSGMGILGKVGAGYLADRVAPPFVLASVFVMEAVGLTALISNESTAGVVVFVLVFGYSMGAVVALQPLVVVHCFGLASMATIFGAMTAFSGFSSALGPIFAGFMRDALGDYTLAYLVFIGVDCFAALLVLPVRPPRLPVPGHTAAMDSAVAPG
jgi:sugar phosphate permease